MEQRRAETDESLRTERNDTDKALQVMEAAEQVAGRERTKPWRASGRLPTIVWGAHEQAHLRPR